MSATPGAPTDESIASFALALDDPMPAPGARPDLDELWDWTAGAVDAARAREIRAHVARDPELYAAWRELRRELAAGAGPAPVPGIAAPVASPIATDGPDATVVPGSSAAPGALERLRAWLATPWLVPAFALVAALAVGLGPALRGPPPVDVWQDWSTPKGLPAPASPAEREELDALLAGVAAALAARGVPVAGPRGERLSMEAPACGTTAAGGAAACESRRAALGELGAASVDARAGCVAGGEPGEAAAARVDAAAAALVGAVGIDRLGPGLERWRGADGGGARCAAVALLLDAALEGLVRDVGG